MFNSDLVLSSQQYGFIHEKYEKGADKRTRVSQKIWKAQRVRATSPIKETGVGLGSPTCSMGSAPSTLTSSSRAEGTPRSP